MTSQSRGREVLRSEKAKNEKERQSWKGKRSLFIVEWQSERADENLRELASCSYVDRVFPFSFLFYFILFFCIC